MFNYQRLWLLVKGGDDDRFAESILRPVFEDMYDDVRVWKYSQQATAKKLSFMRSIRSMQADYLWFCDMDDHPCVSARKESLMGQLEPLDADRIVVVVKEIEARYLAGLDESNSKEMGLQSLDQSDRITKELFNQLIGGTDLHIRTMIEILNRYDTEVARQKSNSFTYFIRKHGPAL